MKGWHVIISYEDSVPNKIYHVSFSLKDVSMSKGSSYMSPVLKHIFLSFFMQPRFPGGILQSNFIIINFDEHYSFLYPECNTFLDFHSESKTTLKYIGWNSSLVPFVIQCFSIAVMISPAFKTFKVNKTLFGFRFNLYFLFLYGFLLL